MSVNGCECVRECVRVCECVRVRECVRVCECESARACACVSVRGCERACGARGRRGGRPATVLSPEDRPFSWCPSGGFALHPDVGPQAVWPLGSVSPPGDAGIGDSRAGPPRRLCVTVAGWGPSPCSPSSGSQTCGEPRPELGGPLSARPTLPPTPAGPPPVPQMESWGFGQFALVPVE